ncbi:NUDIX hydrolase [Aquimarina algiphila]|uniref:NUDIX hydrolase n=1 Tax=Aquimarina algiphila TaxID=2047982 RepID=UPI0024921504|nr:NUDIX domain-containing protein [Aquimarina algiphila]
MSDELIDILDEHGKSTGEIRLKSEAHQLGLYHASVHIWFFTDDGRILFQKRAKNKDSFPDLWDVSVAGHIGAGESPENSAIREIEEEIGILVPVHKLEFIGTYLAKKIPKPDFLDNEFHYIYLSKLDVSIKKLKLQEEEVAGVILFDSNDFKNILHNPIKYKDYVPHDLEYYHFILKEITNRL